MDNKTILKIKNLILADKKKSIIVIVGIVGIILILVSEIPNSTSENNTDDCKSNTFSNNYVLQLEKRTNKIISSIDGVGRCQVMITVSETSENVFAKNIDENNQHGYYSQNNEYVFYKNNNCQEPVLIKESYPKIIGVAIVCDGGDRIEVKKQIIDTVTSLFDIPSSDVSISKIKQ